MKKLATILALSSATLAFGQGSLALDNFTTKLIPIFQPNGTDKVGTGFNAAVFNAGKQLGADIAVQANGRFNGGSVVVPGVDVGAKATALSVKVWDGGSYDAAKTARGESKVFSSNPLGGVGSDGSPVVTPKLVGLESFNLTAVGGPGPGPVVTPVPEPSTIALGAIGALALVFARRK